MNCKWEVKTLGEIINLKRGYDLPASKREDGNIPIMASSGITGYHNEAKVNGPGVVTGRSGQLGKVFYIEEDYWALNTTLYVEDFKGNDPKYIYYLLQTLNFEQLNAGSSVPTLNRNHVHQLKVKIPSISIQKKIGNLLYQFEAKVNVNDSSIKKMEQIAELLFKRWFIDFEFPNEQGLPYRSSGGEMVESELGDIPKGWRVGVLQEVVEFYNGYAFKSKQLLNEPNENCYHVFKMGHIKKGGGLNKSGTKSYFPKEEAKGLEKYILKKGDLLMCMTDMKSNVALLGHTALMDVDDEYVLNQRVGLLRGKDNDFIKYPYLYLLTNNEGFINDLRSRANSGVQVNLSTAEIKASKLVLAEHSVLKMFNDIAEPIFEKIFSLQVQNLRLEEMRDSLLPKLLSGEIEIPDESVVERS